MVALRLGTSSTSWVCPTCARQQSSLRRAHRAPRLRATLQKRYISQKYLQNTKAAETQWEERHQEIRAGKRQSMLSILQERGHVNAIAGSDTSITPHSIGGATAGIGDPTGRTKDRDEMSSHVRKANMVTMHYQLKSMWANVEKYGRKYGYVWEWAWRRALVNNNAWLNNLPFFEILRLLGSGMRVGTMLGRDTAKNKMESGDGLSFGEFSYPVLQAYDWWHMYNNFQLNGIQLQIGGSDQYGNIMSGIEAINHIRKNHYDPDFFLRSSDEDVGRYLKLFTFIPLTDIETIMTEHGSDTSKRVAQRKLAREVLEIIHGEEETKAVEAQHGILFRPSKTALKKQARSRMSKIEDTPPKANSQDFNFLLNKTATPDKPQAAGNVTLPRSLVFSQQIGRILYASGLVASRSEGHRLSAARGAYVGSLPGKEHTDMPDHVDFTPALNWDDDYVNRFIIDGKLLILRAGKWKVKIIHVVDDDEFEKLGLDVPGWEDFKLKQQEQGQARAFNGRQQEIGQS
ncbi:MAG: hypothetical protein Q9207_007664 [Kuettlingeria erythrocarpa]